MKDQNKIRLFETRDFGGNFEASFGFFKQNYGAICKGIIFLIPLALVAAYFTPNSIEINERMAGVTNPMAILGAYGLDFYLGALLSGLINLLIALYTLCYIAVYAQSDNNIVDSSLIWAKIRKNIFPLIGGYIVYSIAIFVGCVLCFIPGIYIAVSLSLFGLVYLVENEDVIGSFKKSHEIVKNNWWFVFGYTIIAGILVALVGAIFAIPQGLVYIGSLLRIESLTGDLFQFITTTIAFVGKMLISPFIYISLGVLYFSLRTEKEGLDMHTKIDDIGVEEPNNNSRYQ